MPEVLFISVVVGHLKTLLGQVKAVIIYPSIVVLRAARELHGGGSSSGGGGDGGG